MPKRTTTTTSLVALALVAVPSAALAELPDSVRAMVDAAIATGDEATVRTVIKIARSTNPDDGEELDRLLSGFETQLAAHKAQAEATKEAQIRSAGLLDNWSGQGELGAFQSSGNTDNTGISASLALTRDGINWRHKLTARADYQRSEGVTTREQFLAAYEANHKFNERFYAFGLAQYERDRFQGFAARYSFSGGLGYDVLTDGPTLSVKAGPAYRRTELIGGTTTSDLAGLAAADFDWAISDKLTLTQDASALVQSGSSTFTLDTGLQAAISNALSVRLSYAVEHDTAPPAGAVKTDTLSRITVIYGF